MHIRQFSTAESVNAAILLNIPKTVLFQFMCFSTHIKIPHISPDSLVRVRHPRPDKVLNVLRRRLVAALELHEGPGEVPHALDRVANHGAVGNGRVRVDHRLEGLFE